MTDKPIISIPIDDSKFKDFLKLFDDYLDKLDDLPDAWKEANKAMDESVEGTGKNISGIKEMLAVSMVQTQRIVEAIQAATPAQERFRRETDKSTKSMSNLHKQAVSVAEGVFTASSGLSGISKILKGFGLPGMIGAGVLGAGFGLGDLALRQARSVSGTARSAFGANLGYGQFQNAQAQLSPFVPNPGALLQNVAAAQWNPASYGMLSLFGVSPNESPLSGAAKIIRGAVQTLGATHNALLPQVQFAEATTGLSETDLISLVNQNPQNLNGAIRKMLNAKLAKQQNVPGATISSDQKLVAGFAASMNTASAKFAQAVAPMNGIVQTFGAYVAKFAGAINGAVQSVTGGGNGSVANGGPGSAAAARAAAAAGGLAPLMYALTGKYSGAARGGTTTNYSGVMRQLEAAGFSTNFAAGVAGNFQRESNFNAAASSFDKRTGWHKGLGQWSKARRDQILAGTGGAIDVWSTNPQEQIAGAIWEFQHTYKGAASKINAAAQHSAWAAAGAVNKYYEASGDTRFGVMMREMNASFFKQGGPQAERAGGDLSPDVKALVKKLATQASAKARVSLEISNSTPARVAMSANSAVY